MGQELFCNGSRAVDLKNVVVQDAFWKREMELVRKEVIPYQWDAINDRVEGAAPSFCMRNFKIAGKITEARKRLGAGYQEKVWPLDTFETLPSDMEHMEERFYGFLFQDSDFAKWIEAVGYSLTQHPDEKLEQIADEAIDIVCAAQQENGYLDTYYIINDMSKVFTNLRDNHELYCFGHLTEGAVAYYQATGKDKLLNAARKYADYICSCFGEGEDQIKGYPGHEIAEMALVRLYEVTGEQKYLDLCDFFLEQRGVRPYYFDVEEPSRVPRGKEAEERYHYHQAHRPVKEQDEAVGHAVRAVYLYSGMADMARLAKDEEMYQACERLWDSIVSKKMYITGGIGGTHIGEAFSFNYDLPNDTAYAETCASIGLVFFARRMLGIHANRKYADVMERALYNGVLSGMALDGKSFFYVNPLEVLPEACHKDERKAHVKPIRQKWFGCACCPPNIARLVSSIASYAYTENEDTLFVHLYMGSKIVKKLDEQELTWTIESAFPWDGKVTIQNNALNPANCTLALRIPEWCKEFSINGEKVANLLLEVWAKDKESLSGMTENCHIEYKDGYLYINKMWSEDDKITLDFAMDVRLMQSHSAVRENEGRLAVLRGPICFCMEEVDNGTNLHQLYLEPTVERIVEEFSSLGEPMCQIKMKGRRYLDCKNGQENSAQKGTTLAAGCGAEEVTENMLYHEYIPTANYEEVELTYIPYYAWNNRGEGEMQVWTRFVR